MAGCTGSREETSGVPGTQNCIELKSREIVKTSVELRFRENAHAAILSVQ